MMHQQTHRRVIWSLAGWLAVSLVLMMPFTVYGQLPAAGRTACAAGAVSAARAPRPICATIAKPAHPRKLGQPARRQSPPRAQSAPRSTRLSPYKRTFLRKARGSIRQGVRGNGHRYARRAEERAFLRRLLQARFPMSVRGQQARLLDEWRIRPIDGDTFGYGAERIRIRGMNAPEVSEPGGFWATERLDLLLREGPVTIVPQALDRYGRTVADVYVNHHNVAEVMTREGYAKQR